MKWIMERETPEERLAAWETVLKIAFPNECELPYAPPQTPSDGSRLSPCDRARRDTYNMMGDFIKSRMWELPMLGKDKRKVAAGRLGAAIRYGMESDSTADDVKTFEQPLPTLMPSTPLLLGQDKNNSSPHVSRADMRAEDDAEYLRRKKVDETKLSQRDREKVAEWDAKIPNAAALKEWLERNYLYQNRSLVCSDMFCEMAYNQLAIENHWISYKTGHAMTDIRNAIHWMAIDYLQKSRQIQRAEEEQHRLDMESEFETKVAHAAQQSPQELATIERKRRRLAEKQAMEMIVKGEL